MHSFRYFYSECQSIKLNIMFFIHIDMFKTNLDLCHEEISDQISLKECLV